LIDFILQEDSVMRSFSRVTRILLIVSFAAMIGVSGCAPKATTSSGSSKATSAEDEANVQEAKSAAESSVKKLSDLRQERIQLENSQQQSLSSQSADDVKTTGDSENKSSDAAK
jgi:hypothetical protein